MAGAAIPTTRDRLVRSAARHFARDGYDGARLQDIAHAAGCTTGAVYAHFEGKAHLLAAVITEGGSGLFNDILAGLSTQAPTLDLLRALTITTQAGRQDDFQRIFVDACAVAVREEDVRATVLPQVEQVREILGMLLSRAQADGELRTEAPTSALGHFALTLLLGGLFARVLGLDQPERADVEVFIGQLFESFTTVELASEVLG